MPDQRQTVINAIDDYAADRRENAVRTAIRMLAHVRKAETLEEARARVDGAIEALGVELGGGDHVAP